MIAQAIEKIEAMSKPIEMDLDDRLYTSKKVYPVIDPTPDCLAVHTLTAIVDYIANNQDAIDLAELTIHIKSYNEVALIGPIFGDFEQRKVYVKASTVLDGFPFGRNISHEEFVVGLQSLFIKDAIVEAILAIVGNLVDENVQTIADDGISQMVTKRTGIQKRENVVIPNPVTLTPYRTFLEADQPSSKFVFRMQSGRGEGSLPTCALFEADGGRWKLDAINNIKKWLVENIGEDIKVLA